MQTRGSIAPSSVAFDWAMGSFSLLIMVGVFQDGWAHNHGLVDQSFFTPWHAILYSTMAVTGLFLLIAGFVNLSRGHAFARALPHGYWTSAIGVCIFLFGGVFDMWWHTKFGIEVDIQGLISPSHLILALGGAMVCAGVLRSIAFQYGANVGGWKRTGPAALASLALLMLLGFFTQYASPFADSTMLNVLHPTPQSGNAISSVTLRNGTERRIAWAAGRDIYGVTVSPDGKRIAYRLESGTGAAPPSDLYVANADGTHAVRITHSGRHDTQAAWSPDGTRIAFISMPAGTSGNFLLQTVRPDGSDLRTLVDGVTTIQSPAWSPDSRRIAFSSRNGLTAEIAIVPSSGGPVTWLASSAGGDTPAWSSRGEIAFDTAEGNIAVARPGDAHATVVVSNAASPSWSADGSQLAYLAPDNGTTQVWVAQADGSHARDVSQLAGADATSAAFGRNAIYFSAQGRPAATASGVGRAFGMDAVMISCIVLMTLVLLLVRRWRMPLGALTIVIGGFSLAMITQNDLYYALPGALVVAVLADLYVGLLGDRARNGVPFYAFSFATPALIVALYFIATQLHAGLGWPSNMILGTPLIAGVVGLLLGFCFALPLSAGPSEPALFGGEFSQLGKDLGATVAARRE